MSNPLAWEVCMRSRRILATLGAVCLMAAALVTAETGPPAGPTLAALVTQRYTELVQQQLVFPLDPTTPNTPENQLGAIVNHFQALSIQFQRLDTKHRQAEQVLAMLSVSNAKLTEKLQKLQTTAPSGLSLPGLPPVSGDTPLPPEEK
jgi:hypothetical protein